METDHPQEHNLLYIALTRSTDRLTLLMNRKTQRVVSPYGGFVASLTQKKTNAPGLYLPIEMAHYASELWPDATV